MKVVTACQAFLGIACLGHVAVALGATDAILDGGAC